MNIIHVYTDGSCGMLPNSPHRNHMGIGIYCKYKNKEIKFSRYIGLGTNNIAELTAIKVALQKLTKYKKRTIKIITDSKYCIGVLTGWKYKFNIELINETKELIKLYPKLKFKWVKGHDGDYGNKTADYLAQAARKKLQNN